MRNLRLGIVLLAFILITPTGLRAADFIEDSQNNQDARDSNFDPFSDYAEFEEGSDEEADVNFFHNGRFFSVGILVGYESFTDILGKIYKPNLTYGIYVTYFFDLRTAIQAVYATGDHALTITDSKTATSVTGKTSLQRFEFDFKYYLNTQNVTRGLAALNPYLVGGLSNYFRTFTINGSAGFVRDTTFGFQGGLGIEVPISRNKIYIGAQGMYHYINFPDESSQISFNGSPTGVSPTGDLFTIVGLMGINF